jgi:hypothetical protein
MGSSKDPLKEVTAGFAKAPKKGGAQEEELTEMEVSSIVTCNISFKMKSLANLTASD